MEDEWFRKDYKRPQSEHNEDVSLEDVDAAFDSSEVIQSECLSLSAVDISVSKKYYVLKAPLNLLYFLLFHRKILWRREG